MDSVTHLSRRNLLRTSALVGLGSICAGLSMLGGCQLVNSAASSTATTVHRIGYLSAATLTADQPQVNAFVK
jgi:hypothetical protein